MVCFRVFSREPSQIEWIELDRYLRVAIAIIETWVQKTGVRIQVKVYEDYTPKRLPRKGRSITSNHINSGLTYLLGDEDGTNILMFRMQEFPKVLCHELLHFYGVGISVDENQSITREFGKLFDTGGNVRLNIEEALTELNATILNAAILCAPGDLIRTLREEFDHTAYNIAMMRAHFQLPKNSWMGWREDTHAFSYVVLKHVLMAEAFHWKEDAFIYPKKIRKHKNIFYMTKTALKF
tara:strand:- start:707 stop:1420 length:714 start_codon:yes stop_codon:yes gene_type:complete